MNDPMMAEPFHLSRFVVAQETTYEQALRELRQGHKESHWMWFVFPQLDGLGTSPTARNYAIRGRAEAAAYLSHPVLGPRLLDCCRALLAVRGQSATDIFGFPDDVKLKSSMTLFARIAGPESVFQQVINVYYSGQMDSRTTALLEQDSRSGS